MLLIITSWLTKYVSAFRVFDYISFRALAACLFALMLSILIGDKVIKWLTKLNLGQTVRDDGPQSHLAKTGTPTMGGVLIILCVIITNLLFIDLKNLYVWLVTYVMLAIGFLGFVDDYRKIVYKNPKGLSARCKILVQSIVAISVGLILVYGIGFPKPTALVIPFFKDAILPFGVVGFLVLTYFVIVGSSNAVNLTDGLDGLVSFPIIIVSFGLAIFTYIAGNKIFAGYLLLPYIPGSHELVVFCGSLVGACLGFLWFNAYPARVFMGDVGALAIGAALGVIAVIVRQELAFAIMGGIFVFEALSVMLQVGSYKMRKKRIFLMAPLHHHFELKGWKENQVVVRFWIISIILLLISLSTIKLR